MHALYFLLQLFEPTSCHLKSYRDALLAGHLPVAFNLDFSGGFGIHGTNVTKAVTPRNQQGGDSSRLAAILECGDLSPLCRCATRRPTQRDKSRWRQSAHSTMLCSRLPRAAENVSGGACASCFKFLRRAEAG